MPDQERQEPLTKNRVLTLTLFALVGLGILACAWLLRPFIPALTWATALCIVAYPLHGWISRRKWSPNLSAAATTAIVTLAILIPAIFLTVQVAQQASDGIQEIERRLQSEGGVEGIIAENPRISSAVEWIRGHVDWERELERLRSVASEGFGRTLGGAVWTATNALVCVLLLFYFLRDQKQTIGLVWQLLPASPKESDEILERVGEVIRSTVYGTLLVSAIQGFLGGLIFWVLGIPGALVWGLVMAILSVVPVLGAFVVWVPAAAFLAIQGDWLKASVLTAWGTIVVGLIDNLLYPIFIGKQTQMHTVPMFLALVGGLTVFGAAGLVIGPIVLAFTWTLLQILRNRADDHAESIDQPSK